MAEVFIPIRNYLAMRERPAVTSAMLTAWQDELDRNMARSVELAKAGQRFSPEYRQLSKDYVAGQDFIEKAIEAFKNRQQAPQIQRPAPTGTTMQQALPATQNQGAMPVQVTPRRDMVPYQTIPRASATDNPQAFARWYAKARTQTATPDFALDPNPYSPEHHYDYPSFYRASLAGRETTPSRPGQHWPSTYKTSGHPRENLPDSRGRMFSTLTARYLDTGEPVPAGELKGSERR